MPIRHKPGAVFDLRRPGPHASIRPLMTHLRADADVLTSAYMAAGMTSRARRPLPCQSAG